MQIIVLGMHRSGTSALARLLNMMGAYFGSEGISTGANKENPKGFWERRDVRQLNDFVLNSVDCDWNKVSNFDVNTLPKAVITEFKEKASKIVLEMDSHRPWLLKEPRLCLLFNLWKELLEVPVCIHINRNPVEVANSLYTRNSIPTHTGIALWEKYNLSALEASNGLSRFVVSHNKLMKDPVSEVKFIYDQLLHCGVDKIRLPTEKEIKSFIRKELYREKVSDKELSQFLNTNQTKLYKEFTSGLILKRKNNFKLSQSSILTLKQYEQIEHRGSNLTQQLNQKDQDAKTALATATKVETDLKQQLTQQEKDLTQQLNQKDQDAKTALATATKVEAELKKQLEQQVMQLSLVKKGVAGIDQYIAKQDEIINQLFKGVDSLVTSRRWIFGNAIFSLRHKLFFRKVPSMATDYLKMVQHRYQSSKVLKKPMHIHVLELVNDEVIGKYNSQKTLPLGPKSSIQEDIKLENVKNKLDIVVCVHNALDDVKNCLNSIVNNTSNKYTLYIIDDGSKPETNKYLDDFNAKHGTSILFRNEEALGYTKSANIGLHASTAEYVVLLNSDTIVTPMWDSKIIACGESNPQVGIIGPLSNAASWQSIPERYSNDGDWKVNDVPEGMDINFLGNLLSKISEKKYPIVPLINGFCFTIKRSVIDKVGFLDEEAFPRGYGEENDYCFRAGENGFLLAIADDTYVFHAKSKSFTHEGRKKLAKQGGDKLKELYGKQAINDAVSVLRDSVPLSNIREALNFSFTYDEYNSVTDFVNTKMKVLFLLPVSGGGGGVHSIVQETLGMRSLGVYARVAVPAKHKTKFELAYPNNWDQVFYFFKNEDDIKLYASKFDVAVATIFTSVQLLEKIVLSSPDIIPAYYIQDYEPWFCDVGTDLYKEALKSYTRVPNMKCFAKTNWICEIVNDKHGIKVDKVIPSIDREVYYPSVLDEKTSDVLTISAMIRPKTPRRSPELTMRVLKQIGDDFGVKVKILIFGCDNNDPFFTEHNWNFDYTNYGHITREEVSDILRKSDIFLDLSEYQAFGRTGLEAMACGCVPVLPSIGGVYEYAINDINSLIVDTKPDSELNIIHAINDLINNISKVDKMKNNGLSTANNYSIESAAKSEIDLLISIKEVGNEK